MRAESWGVTFCVLLSSGCSHQIPLAALDHGLTYQSVGNHRSGYLPPIASDPVRTQPGMVLRITQIQVPPTTAGSLQSGSVISSQDWEIPESAEPDGPVKFSSPHDWFVLGYLGRFAVENSARAPADVDWLTKLATTGVSVSQLPRLVRQSGALAGPADAGSARRNREQICGSPVVVQGQGQSPKINMLSFEGVNHFSQQPWTLAQQHSSPNTLITPLVALKLYGHPEPYLAPLCWTYADLERTLGIRVKEVWRLNRWIPFAAPQKDGPEVPKHCDGMQPCEIRVDARKVSIRGLDDRSRIRFEDVPDPLSLPPALLVSRAEVGDMLVAHRDIVVFSTDEANWRPGHRTTIPTKPAGR